MGASIYYEPVNRKRHSVNAMAPQSFIKSMERAFGRFPLRLDEAALPKLQGMSAMWTDEKHNPYDDLCEGIHKFGEIEVGAEY